MSAKEQLDWCQRNHATVWFGRNGVKIKVSDFHGAVSGASLPDAIAHIEAVRQERKTIADALASLDTKETDR